MLPDLPPLGSVLGSSYRLVSKLGEGAMGVVFLASRGGEPRFAVKVLGLDSGDTAGVARFTREARVASNLKSDHIVPVVESGIDPTTGLCFLAMPLVSGEDVGQLSNRVGPLPPMVAARIVMQAARGLVCAHEAGVIHRDVKPSNLMLSIDGDRVTVMVADFGIAKEATAVEALTSTGAAMGSPIYMAPEQFRNAKAVDHRADVWSLAMTLYELLAGHSPFRELRSVAEVCLKISVGDFPPVQELAPWVPERLAFVLNGALRPSLDERCPSMQAFADALLGCLDADEPLTTADLRGVNDAERAVVGTRPKGLTSWGADVAPALDATLRTDDPLVGETLGGGYRLVRKIGQGGMGAVYEAVTPAGDRAAVKVVRGGSELRDTLRRFVREARATRSIDNEHVVRVLDADDGAGVPFLAMELLSGLDLDTLVKRAGALEPRAVARIFVEAATGLAAAHALGIVHRDVKPANLFLHERADGTIVTKVCDFGVAKNVVVSEAEVTTLELTRTGGMLGSPMYMSPEQARNAKSVDARTDVWSLSLSLYEALTGRKPWVDCSSMGELILAICTTDITPVQELAPWVDPALAAVVHKGLHRQLGDRWSSIAEFAAALDVLASDHPVTRSELCALTIDARSKVASRAPAAFSSSATPSVSNVSTASERPRRFTLLAAAAAVAVMGAAAWWSRSTATGASPPPVASVVVPATASAPARHSVTVRVQPPDAKVTVGGASRAVGADGAITLDGEIGETFDVVAVALGVERRIRVFIARDGTADPPMLVVPPPAATGEPPASAKSAARPASPTKSPTGSGGAPAAPAAPPPTPAAPKLHGDLLRHATTVCGALVRPSVGCDERRPRTTGPSSELVISDRDGARPEEGGGAGPVEEGPRALRHGGRREGARLLSSISRGVRGEG